MSAPRHWLVGPRFDLGLLLGPPVLAVLAVLALPDWREPELPLWGFLVFIVGIDVAHVYASLYRTVLDPDERSRRRHLYVATPIACWLAGVVLHSIDALVFWRVLAYLAVFHFVRQQYGFVMLYRARAGEPSGLDRRLDAAAIYATMLYPLAYWHAAGERRFVWFVPGDFVALPALVASAAAALYAAVLLAFSVRQLWLWRTGRPPSLGKIGVVAATAAVWYVGIVHFDSDFAFTVTNVVAHGVPYLALVWLYGARKWRREAGWRGIVFRPAAAGLFLAPLLGFALVEETLWDRLVWHEHGALFGLLRAVRLTDAWAHLLVPLLAVPQATHYVVDAWIWRLDGSNPDLAALVLGDTASRPPRSTAGAS